MELRGAAMAIENSRDDITISIECPRRELYAKGRMMNPHRLIAN